jgi:hypothetical protein
MSQVAASGDPALRSFVTSLRRDQHAVTAGLRCQASSVAGVTGKTSAQRRRVMNRVSTANQARSAGSYRTRPPRGEGSAADRRPSGPSGPTAGAAGQAPHAAPPEPPGDFTSQVRSIIHSGAPLSHRAP